MLSVKDGMVYFRAIDYGFLAHAHYSNLYLLTPDMFENKGFQPQATLCKIKGTRFLVLIASKITKLNLYF